MKKGVGKLITGALLLAGAGIVAPLLIFIIPLLTAPAFLTLEAPGSGTFEVDDAPITLTLWYDYSVVHNGKTYRTGDLPSGWSFELESVDSRTAYALKTVMGSMTKSGTKSESYAVGNFVDLPAGEYHFTVTGEGEPRIFTLQKAWLTGDFTQSLVYLGMAGVIALIGTLLFIIGLIQAVRKTPSPETA